MSAQQVATNAAATRWLADLLERWDVDNPVDRAEFIARELLDQGLARIPRPIPLQPTTPPASDEARAAYLEQARADIEAKRLARTTTRTEPTR